MCATSIEAKGIARQPEAALDELRLAGSYFVVCGVNAHRPIAISATPSSPQRAAEPTLDPISKNMSEIFRPVYRRANPAAIEPVSGLQHLARLC